MASTEPSAASGGFAREITLLSDADRQARKRAIAKLGDELTTLSSTHLVSLLKDQSSGGVLRALVACLTDPVEGIRESSAELCERLLTLCGNLDERDEVRGIFPPLLFPALKTRIGARRVVEDSEEVRLALAKLHRALLLSVQPTDLTPFADDACAILVSCLADDFHEVKKEACASVRLAADSSRTEPEGHAEYFLGNAERMVSVADAILLNLEHSHAKVRLACVDALGACMSTNVDVETLEKLVPKLRALAYDKQPLVRERFGICVANILLAHGARNKSARSLLLPLMLQGIGDDVASVSSKTALLFEKTASSMSGSRGGENGSGSLSDVQDGLNQTTLYGVDLVELGGFAASLRSSLPSSCALIREHLEDLLSNVLREMGEWTKALRGAATSLLGILIAYSGSHVASSLPSVFEKICAAFTEEDEYVTKRLIACCILVGGAVPPDAWIPLAIRHVSTATGSTQAGALVMLCMLLFGATESRTESGGNVPLTASDFESIASCLASDAVRCSQHDGARVQLLQLVHRTISSVKSAGLDMSRDLKEEFSLNIFLVLLQLKSLPNHSSLNAQASLEIGALASVMDDVGSSNRLKPDVDAPPPLPPGGHLSAQEMRLHAHFFSSVLNSVVENKDVSLWAEGDPEVLLVDALLRNAGAAVAMAGGEEIHALVSLFCTATDPDLHEPAFRSIFLELLESIFLSTPRGEHARAVWHGVPAATLLAKVFTKNASWGVGRVAAACRFANVRALLAFSSVEGICGRAELSPALPSLLPSLLSCCEEDYYADTRLDAIRCLEAILRVMGEGLGGSGTEDPFEERRRQIYPALLARMDDSDDRVRLATTAGLLAFLEGAGGYDTTNLGYLIKGTLVHMDDANSDIQRAVCNVIKAACIVCREVVLEHLPEARATHRNQSYVAEIDNFLSAGQ